MATGAISASVSSMTETDRRIEEYSGNIANVGTKGYKGFQAQAQSVVNSSGKSAGGVLSVTRQLVDQQGKMERTEFATDIALSGQGFFVVTDKLDENGNIGQLFFTREGSFRKDNLGRFVNGAEYLLTGWPLDSNERLPETKSLSQSLKVVDVKQLISEASSTTEIKFGANLNSEQKVAGGGVTTLNILNKGLKASPANFNIRATDILFPNASNNLTIGEGIKLTSYTPSSNTKIEKVIEFGGFVQSRVFNSTGTDLVGTSTDDLKFTVNARELANITRGTGATNQVVLENIAQQINENSTGDFSVRARVVTQYIGGVLQSSLLVAPDKANYSLTFAGNTTLRNTLGFQDEKNIKQFTLSSSNDVIGRFASLQDLKEHMTTAGLNADVFSADSVGANITIKSANPLFIENFSKGSGSDFLEEFGLKQGYLATNYDPYDSSNNIAGKAFQAHFSQDVEVYDRMGNKHVLIMAFLKLDTNRWAVEVYANDPSKVNISGRTDGLLQAGVLTFDGRGNLQSMLNTTQLAKTKNISSPHLPLGATNGQLFEINVSAGSTSVKHTFTYGSPIASSDYFTAGDFDLVGTAGNQLNITYKTSATDPGQTFNLTRGSGTTNIDVLKNLANQINTTATLKDLVRADIIYDKSGTNKYKIDIRPIDSTKIVEFGETPAAGFGTDLGITSADNIAASSFNSLYELAEQINSTEGPFALQAEVITGTLNNTYRLKIQPKNPSLSMTFGGNAQTIGSPIGTGVSTTIYDALGLKNTSSSNQLAALDDEFVVNWSAIVGADPNSISVKYGDIGSANGIGQVSGIYSIKSKETNGWSTGQLSGVTVDNDGYIIAQFTNNRTRKIFKLAIADFANPNGLIPYAGNVFCASKDSGPYNLKEAGTEGVGKVLSGTLEGSNIDTADQLTKLILAQRQYQASAKVISVVDKLQEDLLHRTFNT